jgi:hypothetical protein
MYAAGSVYPRSHKVDHTAFGSLMPDKPSRIISTKKLCADAIVRYGPRDAEQRRQLCGDAAPSGDGKVDALEFYVTAACRGAGKTLQEIG